MGLEDAVVPAALTGLAGWVVGRRRGSNHHGADPGDGSRAGTVVRDVGRRLSTTAAATIAQAGQVAVVASSRAVAAAGTAVASGLGAAIDVTADGAGKVWRVGSGVAARSSKGSDTARSSEPLTEPSSEPSSGLLSGPSGGSSEEDETATGKTSTRRTPGRDPRPSSAP